MKAYALFAMAIAALMVISGAALVTGHTATTSNDQQSQSPWDDHDNRNQTRDHNETHEENETEDHDNETHDLDEENAANMTAGGGGWFMVRNQSGILFKDTFGMFLDARPGHFNNSSFVFQARDAMHLTIHAVQFDRITIDNTTVAGKLTANATGRAVAGGQNWTFTLVVTDIGKGAQDKFMLKVSNATKTMIWQTNGLGGGNIWVELQEPDQDSESAAQSQAVATASVVGAFAILGVLGLLLRPLL